jgi:hypothetical protein
LVAGSCRICFEEVTALGNGLYDALIVILKGFPNLQKALRE